MTEGSLGWLLNEASVTLNTETDELSASIRDLEAFVNEKRLGIEVELDGWGFGRVDNGGRWGFYKVVKAVGSDVRRSVIECPKDDRIKFSEVARPLIAKLIVAANEQRLKMVKANVLLRDEIKRLKGEA